MTIANRNQTQAEKAYKVIRSRLLASSLESGSRLNEYYWADQLSVNRGDVRQALARLYADGLIEKAAKKGFLVKTYSPKDLQYLNETRLMLETAAAHLAIKRATRTDISKLKQICKLMKEMAENHYTLGLCEADVSFHQQFVNCAHNPKLSEVYLKASIPITAFVILSGQTENQKLRQDTEQHLKITEALEKKDLDLLIAILGQMFNGTTAHR